MYRVIEVTSCTTNVRKKWVYKVGRYQQMVLEVFSKQDEVVKLEDNLKHLFEIASEFPD